MLLREFFTADAVRLPLRATGKDEVLAELVGLLATDDKTGDTLLKMLKRRESLGSTGVGRGVAVEHDGDVFAQAGEHGCILPYPT